MATKKARKLGPSMERDMLTAIKNFEDLEARMRETLIEDEMLAALSGPEVDAAHVMMDQILMGDPCGLEAVMMRHLSSAEQAEPLQTLVDAALKRRAYDPERAMMWQSFKEIYSVKMLRRIINEEFPIMYSYLKNRLRKEYDKIGHDSAARTNARAENWFDETNRVMSGQHVHTPDFQELASNALVKIWKKCKSIKFIDRCEERDVSPIVMAVCNAANNVINNRYGTNARKSPMAENEVSGLGHANQFLDGQEFSLTRESDHADMLDALIAMEERGELTFAPRRHWEGYSLESQVGGLVAALVE